MKYLAAACYLLLFALKSMAQTPANDPTWTLNWSDEFNYYGKPNNTYWKWGKPWGADWNDSVVITTDGHNLTVNDSFASLLARRGSYAEDWYGDTIRRNFTTGAITMQQNFQYGYFEARLRMPDSYPAVFGSGYHNNAFWLFNQDIAQDVDWSELDFEIVTGTPPDVGLPFTNRMQPNIHMEKPYGTNEAFKTATGDGNVYDDPSHFTSWYTSTPPTWWVFYDLYYNSGLTFAGGWHTFGFEWLPGQIKYYLDGKLCFRLEANYEYSYTDYWGGHDTIYPVRDLNAPMPIILDNDIGSGGNSSLAGPDSLSFDIDYVRYQCRLLKEL